MTSEHTPAAAGQTGKKFHFGHLVVSELAGYWIFFTSKGHFFISHHAFKFSFEVIAFPLIKHDSVYLHLHKTINLIN